MAHGGRQTDPSELDAHHVGELLEQAISHVEHVRAGLARGAAHRQLAEA